MANTNGGGVEIKILAMDSRTYTVRVDKSVPVPTLKQQIADVTGVFPAHQRLLFGGKALRDEENLNSYHVEDGHTLHLVVKEAVDPAPESALDTPIAPAPNRISEVDQRALIGYLSNQVVLVRQVAHEELGLRNLLYRVTGELAANADTDAQRTLERVGLINNQVSNGVLQLVVDRMDLLRTIVTGRLGQTPAMVQAPAVVSEEGLSSQASGDQDSASSRREDDEPEARRRRRG